MIRPETASSTSAARHIAPQPRPVAGIWIGLTGALLLFATVTLLVSLWPSYRQLATPCPNLGPCFGSMLTEAEAAELTRYGLSIELYAGLIFLLQLVAGAGFLGIAAVLFWRRRDDPMALCTTAVFALLAVEMADRLTAIIGVQGPYTALITLVHGLTVGAIILFYAIFPTGTFIPRMLRWYAPLLIGCYGATLALTTLIASPIVRYQLTLGVQTIALGSMVAAQIYRYVRHSTPDQRRQTQWLIGCSLTYTSYRLGSAWFFQAFGIVGSEQRALLNASLIVVLHGLELAIVCGAIVMLRRGFYRLDRLIGRTLVYALLTVCIVLLYIVIVGGLSLLLRPTSNALVALFATGIIAAAVQPLRAALQRAVNQLFYGRRDDPREVIAALGRHLERVVAPDAVLATIVETLARELRLPYAAIVLDDRDEAAAASVGAPTEPLLTLPLVDGGVGIGHLFVALRAPDEPFSAAERRLLDDLARQSGVAVRAARLNHQLQRSRERLVTAREEERRRLQRDLHDELGPNLASMSMQLDAARTVFNADPAAGEALLSDVQGQLQEALATVRQLVHQLRPPLLDQLGLLGAVRECALRMERGAHLQISLDLPATLPPLNAAVEAAAYFIVAEALTNSVRHAQADMCTVRLHADAELLVEVADNGTGKPDGALLGVGLRSMRERAQELGGTWTMAAATGGGTVVRARLPIA